MTPSIRRSAVSPRRALTRAMWLVAIATILVPLRSTSGQATSDSASGQSPEPAVRRIESRRELFVDRWLVAKLERAEIRLHHPIPREAALVHDEPWEGTGSGYHSIFHDGEKYRMYYKAWQLDVLPGKLKTNRHPLYCCYAESRDGIRWTKPRLGLHEFEGSKDNNIVLVSGRMGKLNIDAGHPAVFLDERPGVPPDARFKAVVRSQSPHGLCILKSPDGIHWSPHIDHPVLGKLGAFDSQNLAFWDPVLGKYRAYWRIFTAGVTNGETWKPAGVRAIRTAVSDDLEHWTQVRDLQYVDSPVEQLYTNQVKPYGRAPHLLIGFPTRYVERGWSPSMKALPELDDRQLRASSSQRYGTALTEGLLMTSRDGVVFDRWNEAFLRPGIERPGTWQYGQQYIAWHVVETPSSLPGAPKELSLFATERYWKGEGTVLRRYTLRLDGFASLHGDARGGKATTHPLTFAGRTLHLNFSSSAAGSVRVEIRDGEGQPIPGYTLADCDALFGDSVDRTVTWGGRSDVGSLAGRPVQLVFTLHDADVYALWFHE